MSGAGLFFSAPNKKSRSVNTLIRRDSFRFAIFSQPLLTLNEARSVEAMQADHARAP
jgi:hypothetical protein